MRRPLVPALAASAALALVLAGCSGGDGGTDADGAAAECTASGAFSDAVQIEGAFGEEPTVTVDEAIDADETQRTVVEEGDGAEVEAGQTAKVTLSVYSATGEALSVSPYDGSASTPVAVDDTQIIPGIVKTIQCSTVGSRVVGVATAADAFGDQGNEQLGVAADETVVFVVDIDGVVPSRADGEEQEPTDGFPAVTFADDGTPTIEIPEGEDPPAEFQLAQLRVGDGEEVPAGANVTVQYTGVNWRTGEEFDSSWSRGAPQGFPVDGVVPGFRDAIVGQTVGSQVIAILPPSAGYGEAGQPSAGIEGTDTLVFVVDILDFTAAAG